MLICQNIFISAFFKIIYGYYDRPDRVKKTQIQSQFSFCYILRINKKGNTAKYPIIKIT